GIGPDRIVLRAEAEERQEPERAGGIVVDRDVALQVARVRDHLEAFDLRREPLPERRIDLVGALLEARRRLPLERPPELGQRLAEAPEQRIVVRDVRIVGPVTRGEYLGGAQEDL